MLISNDFYVGKNPKLAPTYTGPGEIIDINDTNAKVKINNKIKILNVNKLKLFLQEHQSEQEQTFLDYNFNDAESEKPLTRARAKLINYKNAAQLALLMLSMMHKMRHYWRKLLILCIFRCELFFYLVISSLVTYFNSDHCTKLEVFQFVYSAPCIDKQS